MTLNSTDPREALTPGDRESNAAGEASAIVEQASQGCEDAINRLHALTDDQLASLVAELDGALAGIRDSMAVTIAEDATYVAACARILLRQRRQVAAARHASEIASRFVGPKGVAADAVHP